MVDIDTLINDMMKCESFYMSDSHKVIFFLALKAAEARRIENKLGVVRGLPLHTPEEYRCFDDSVKAEAAYKKEVNE